MEESDYWQDVKHPYAQVYNLSGPRLFHIISGKFVFPIMLLKTGSEACQFRLYHLLPYSCKYKLIKMRAKIEGASMLISLDIRTLTRMPSNVTVT